MGSVIRLFRIPLTNAAQRVYEAGHFAGAAYSSWQAADAALLLHGR